MISPLNVPLVAFTSPLNVPLFAIISPVNFPVPSIDNDVPSHFSFPPPKLNLPSDRHKILPIVFPKRFLLFPFQLLEIIFPVLIHPPLIVVFPSVNPLNVFVTFFDKLSRLVDKLLTESSLATP